MRWLATGVVALAMAIPGAPARARMDSELRYPFVQTWPAAVRLVRVDMGFPVDEKDRENGYLLFRYHDGEKLYPGSVELIRTQVRGVEGVQVIVQVPKMPRYVERLILQKLERKLQREYGEPREPPEKPPEHDGAGDEEEDEEDEKEGEKGAGND